jgi:biopolymer transport protein TolR
MAISLKSSRSKFSRRQTQQMSEINVTPFVDVMLVLLVIFMITAPLLTVGVQVDLPQTKASTIQGSDEPLAVSVDRDGKVYIQDTETSVETVVAKLRAITGNNVDVRIFVRGDEAVNYGRVMEVMGVVNAAGFKRVALISRQPGSKRRAKPGGKPAGGQPKAKKVQ